MPFTAPDSANASDDAVKYASEADTLVIESNYDTDMLLGGSYTEELKMRIMQGCGSPSGDPLTPVEMPR